MGWRKKKDLSETRLKRSPVEGAPYLFFSGVEVTPKKFFSPLTDRFEHRKLLGVVSQFVQRPGWPLTQTAALRAHRRRKPSFSKTERGAIFFPHSVLEGRSKKAGLGSIPKPLKCP
jgi:hypothetical protein